ncbi:hypothetical protein HAALTHF_40890n [Vreelandella aquamarina]|nr:hypothetical protein HAALTHF_40890n [Halomonas axialensis]
MKVFADQLPAALAKKLPKAVIVAGDEPLQHRDACDAVRAAARQAGIEEREVLDVEPNFAWGGSWKPRATSRCLPPTNCWSCVWAIKSWGRKAARRLLNMRK